MKKAIVIVFLVALTLTAFGMLLAPNVKADVSEVKVLSYNWYVAPSNTALAVYIGDLVVVGEVQNVGSNNLNFVVVGGIAYNSTGDVVASSESQVFSNELLPGQKAPFYLDFPPETSVTQDQSWVPSVTNVTMFVTYVNDTTAKRYSGLTIPAAATTSYVDSNFKYTVAGAVTNIGNETTGSVWVVTTFYNASGSAVSMNFTDYLTSSLAPGASALFTATPVDNTPQLSSQITNYSVEIQSLPLAASPSPPPSTSPSVQPTSSPGVTPSATSQPSQTPSGQQPSDSNGLIYAVVIAVVIVVVVVAVLILLRKRGK